VALEVNSGFEELDALALQHFSLKGSVRFADEEFAAVPDHAVPGDAFS
jgi:hypothetical protein